MEPLGTCKVYVNGKFETFTLYQAPSASKHKASDNVTLKQALIQALNASDTEKEHEGNGVYRMKINRGLGRVVYKLNAMKDIPNSAAIFHYHWNYSMDLPLTVDD